MQKLTAIHGYRDRNPKGIDAPGGEAGSCYHEQGIGHVRVQLADGRSFYVAGDDLARFAELYDALGPAVLDTWKSVSLKR